MPTCSWEAELVPLDFCIMLSWDPIARHLFSVDVAEIRSPIIRIKQPHPSLTSHLGRPLVLLFLSGLLRSLGRRWCFVGMSACWPGGPTFEGQESRFLHLFSLRVCGGGKIWISIRHRIRIRLRLHYSGPVCVCRCLAGALAAGCESPDTAHGAPLHIVTRDYACTDVYYLCTNAVCYRLMYESVRG